MLRLLLGIPSAPDTNHLECTSSDVEEAHLQILLSSDHEIED